MGKVGSLQLAGRTSAAGRWARMPIASEKASTAGKAAKMQFLQEESECCKEGTATEHMHTTAVDSTRVP